MKLGMKVGFRPGHSVLDGDQAPLHQRDTAPVQFSATPPQKGDPNFRPMFIVAKRLDGWSLYLEWR